MPSHPPPASPNAALAEEGPVVAAIRAAWPDALDAARAGLVSDIEKKGTVYGR